MSIGNPQVIRAVASKLEYDDKQYSFVQEVRNNKDPAGKVGTTGDGKAPIQRQTTKQLKDKIRFSDTYKKIKENRDINVQDLNLQEMMNNQYAIVIRQSSNQTGGSGGANPINLFGGYEDPMNKELVDTAYVSRPMNPSFNK
jgi:hypothetical protein